MKERFYEHRADLRHGIHFNQHLQHSWNKYGEENFTFTVIEYCERSLLDERECYFITLFQVRNPELGYNKKDGGQNGGSTMNEDVGKRISESLKRLYAQNPTETHKRFSENTRKCWQDPEYRRMHTGEYASRYGSHQTEEAKQRISEAQKNRKRGPLSEEQKKKISEKNSGIEPPCKDKTPVYCFELDRVFQDATAALNELGLSKDNHHILDVCRGKRKTCGGYHWRYLTQEEIQKWENNNC